MVVEEFQVELDADEKELLLNPEKWFLKIPEGSNTSFVTALERWSKRHPEGDVDRVRKNRPKNAKSQRGYRLQKLVSSLLRPDKRQPPLCIFCFDDGSDTNELCGRLRWCPNIPLFFALHELCVLMTPEILTVDNPTPLGKELFDTDLKEIHRAYSRGRTLVCSICYEKGAGIGCCSSSCQRVFHLPCAIRSMCYLDYENFRCFCPKHSRAAFEKTTTLLLSHNLEKIAVSPLPLPENDCTTTAMQLQTGKAAFSKHMKGRFPLFTSWNLVLAHEWTITLAIPSS